MKTIKLILTSLFITLLTTLPAAAVPRVFVSGHGSDANPGSITSPKRSFASALTVTDAGGEIIVLDSAGYGPVTITQSVSIISPTGVYAGVTVTSGDGITVNASGSVVILRGLTINGAGGNAGINFTSGAVLHVESCVISGMGADGIFSSASGSLFVKDTIARNNGNNGIYLQNSGKGSIDQMRAENNSNYGVVVQGAKASIRNSVVSGNTKGLSAFGSGSELNIESCLSANNGYGVASEAGGSSVVRVSNSTVTDNGFGLSASSGSLLLTRGNNTVEGNSTDGSFTGTYASK
jgi:parallel beta helix pectate lyase-like protein